MKKIILALLVPLMLLTSVDSFATTLLKPSLEAQMKLQSTQDIKAKNVTRLAELRAMRLANKRGLLKPMTYTSISTNIKSNTSTGKTTTISSQIKSTSIINLSTPPSIPGIDMNRVRSTWLGWYNDVRAGQGLAPYVYDTRLDATAFDWNKSFTAGKGQNHHRRNPSDSYYDYPKITTWFKDRGVVGKVVNGSTITENVGWGTYSCSSGDCTNSLISSIRTTLDFFMNEKGKAYDVHYRSIVQPNFTKIGLSVIVEPSERRYYLVVHYITE